MMSLAAIIIIADKAPLKIKIDFVSTCYCLHSDTSRVITYLSWISPEDEILTKVEECQAPISFERGVLVLLQELVILLSLVVFIVEILRKICS